MRQEVQNFSVRIFFVSKRVNALASGMHNNAENSMLFQNVLIEVQGTIVEGTSHENAIHIIYYIQDNDVNDRRISLYS